MAQSSFFWKGLLVSLFLSVVFLYSLVFNISKALGFSHNDAYLVNFILKHWVEVIYSGNWSNLFTLPMFYGFENSLFFSDHHFIQAIFSLPIYALTKDIILTSNLLVFFTVGFSIFSMYLLAWHFTKSFWPSLLAGVIFVLNPFIFGRFPDQLILISLQWIPLIFLFLEKSLDEPKNKNIFLLFLFLTCQLLSSLYYSVFLTVILPIYFVFRIRAKRVKLIHFVNRGLVIGLVIFGLTLALSVCLYYQVFSKYPINRQLEAVVLLYSARPSDYLFTAPSNLLYGSLKEKAVLAFPRLVRFGIYSEQNLFFGLIPLILLFLSFKKLSGGPDRRIWLTFLGLMLLSVLLSFGPRITFSENFSISGPYKLVYFLDPAFSFLRTAARFGVFAFFFLALISALVTKELFKKFERRTAAVLVIALILVILVEYWNKPLEFYNDDETTKQFYQTLNQERQIKVILDYPIGNLISYPYPQARAEDLDGHYLLYATIFHNKKLFNGYTGFLPQEYYDRANQLSIDFPDKEMLKLLKDWGVDAIILHRDEFNLTAEFYRIRKEMQSLEIPLRASSPNLALFDLTKVQNNQK